MIPRQNGFRAKMSPAPKWAILIGQAQLANSLKKEPQETQDESSFVKDLKLAPIKKKLQHGGQKIAVKAKMKTKTYKIMKLEKWLMQSNILGKLEDVENEQREMIV